MAVEKNESASFFLSSVAAMTIAAVCLYCTYGLAESAAELAASRCFRSYPRTEIIIPLAVFIGLGVFTAGIAWGPHIHIAMFLKKIMLGRNNFLFGIPAMDERYSGNMFSIKAHELLSRAALEDLTLEDVLSHAGKKGFTKVFFYEKESNIRINDLEVAER